MKHWLAWNPDDGERDSATVFSMQNDNVYDSAGVANAMAEREWDDSAGEVGHEFKISVVEIADDGTEASNVFDILVEYEPTFSARKAP